MRSELRNSLNLLLSSHFSDTDWIIINPTGL